MRTIAFLLLSVFLSTSAAQAVPLPGFIRGRLAKNKLASIQKQVVALNKQAQTFGGVVAIAPGKSLSHLSCKQANRLTRKINRLSKHIYKLNSGSRLQPLLKQLGAMKLPQLSVRVEAAMYGRLFGKPQPGFTDDSVASMYAFGNLQEAYSKLYQTAGAKGVQMNRLKVKLVVDRSAGGYAVDINGFPNGPGLDMDVVRR